MTSTAAKLAAEQKGEKRAPRKVIDWESLEIKYRAGTRSLKDIGREFGVSDAAIIKRAKRDGWTRDLRAKIQAKADAKVSASLVSAEVSARQAITEKDVIEVEAQVQARIRLTHRKDIAKSRTLTMSLLEELEAQTGSAELMQQLGEIMGDPEKSGNDRKMAEAYSKAISLGGRVSTMKALSDTLRTLVTLEREAFGLNDIAAATTNDVGDLSDEDLDARINERIQLTSR